MPCPYANALGVPGEGVHAARFLGMAQNDWIMTIIGALLISFLFQVNPLYSFFGLFIGGEILHYVFGVNTAFLKMIGLEPDCD
jgi:hypothetical protein